MVNKENSESLNILYAEEIEDAFDNSDIVLILNNHKYFEDMPLPKLMNRMNKPGLLYDLWNNFSAADLDLPNGLVYSGLGNLSQSNIYN